MTARFNALLVEGIPGIGKSTLIDALLRRHVVDAPARNVRTLVHLAQTHTFGPLAAPADAGTLTVAGNRAHLERIVGMMEWLHAGVQHRAHPPCYVLIDTLHLTHCLRPGVLEWSDVAEFDARLAALGCKLLLLRARTEVVRARSVDARWTTSFVRDYAVRFGGTHDELHAYFLREQDRFTDMFARSAMPKLELANDGAVEDVIDEADGLWRDDATIVRAGFAGRRDQLTVPLCDEELSMAMNAGQLYQFLTDNSITSSSTLPVTLTGAGPLKEVNVDVDGERGPAGGLFLEPTT